MEKTVRSIERALQILECFSMDKPVLTFTELVKGTGLSKSTVSRILSTLISIEYIKQDHLTQRYSLGFKLFNLGSVVGNNISLRKVALPYLHKLCTDIKETISLNIIENDERVCIEIVESSEEIRNFVKVGQRNSLFVGASGKLLLAFTEDAIREELILKNNHLDIQQKNEWKKDLSDIREKGYVFMKEGRVKGSFAFSAPIFDKTNKLAGSLTIAGPIHRSSELHETYVIEKILETAANISREIGYQGRQ
jgi:IclR family KDG regulon transcriptional repressor